MLGSWVWGAFIIGGTGAAIHFLLIWMKSEYELTWKEFGFVMAAFMSLGLFGIIKVFDYVAVHNLVTYKENWSGFETRANWWKTTCSEDGPCIHCYDCHPYTEEEEYDCSYTDSDGEEVSRTCTREVTRYHSCPYTTEEWTFTVDTSTGDKVTMGYHWFPTNPQQHRWKSWGDFWLPRLPSSVRSGVPANWQAASDRLAANQPGPVVFRHAYPNYILAAERTILRTFSSKIEYYAKAGLLPAFRTQVIGDYTGDRVYFVGSRPEGDWRTASNYFNGALGAEREGDLHLVIIDASKVAPGDADDYIGALVAYWQGQDFGKDTLSKNGIVLVLGTTDNKTVAWARGATGMPSGNELLALELRENLAGKSLDPATIFGNPTATIEAGGKLKVAHTAGAIESIFWGPGGFKRVSMKEYQYLKHEIKPTPEQMVWLYAIIFILSLIAWAMAAYNGPATFHKWRRSY
jgi:hypothetical protein